MRNISFTSGKGISTLITTHKETTTQRILKRAMVQVFCGSSTSGNRNTFTRFFSPQKQIRRRNCIVANSSSSFQREQQRTIRGISLLNETDNKNVHPSHVLCPDDFMPSPTDDEDATKFELPRKKIPIALVLAYVGDTFKGNTQNVMLPRGSTVDDVIEDAIYKAGGILFSNYRSKGLSRLKWSRSSRTDKGVSSLFTVVGLRMEAPVRAYGGGKEVVGEEETKDEEDERKSSSRNRSSKRSEEEEEEDDAEAKALIVEKINRHLPTDTVKAFACFKATKSFDARRAAISRTYEYLLPLKCLRDDKNGELEMFREALKTFEGSHPFHNYTKRGLYGAGKGNDKNRKGGRGNRNKKNALTEDDDGLGETSSSEEQELEEEEEEKELPKRIETSGKHTYWLLEKDVDDLVHVMHYRRIHEFTCSKEPEIIEGFESYPFVRVKVYGESFMLHQIRKMIATAVLVALDSEETPTMPLSFIKASLCRPCRVVTPMAPPLTLFLTGAEFMSFRKTNHEEKTRAAKAEEEEENEEEDDKETEKGKLRSLTISEETKNDIDRFRREHLYPKLAESFSNQDWDFFIENVRNVEPTREEYLNIVKQYESYDEMRKIRAKEKEEEEEEASSMIEKSLL